MRNFKYLLLSFVVSGLMMSCYDDDPIEATTIQGLADVTLGVSSTNAVVGEGSAVPFTATIPQAFTEDSSIDVQLDFEGGRVNTPVTIPAGATSASGTITMSQIDGADKFTGVDVTLSLQGLLVENTAAGTPSVYNVNSNGVVLRSYDAQVFPGYGAGVVNSRATVLMDWENPGANDLDMRIFDEDFNLIESAGSGSRYETDILNTEHPDANYFVVVDFFGASGDIPWQIFFQQPDEETVVLFRGTFTADEVDSGQVFPVIEYTKTTVGGESVYTFPTKKTKRTFTQAQLAKMKAQIVEKEN